MHIDLPPNAICKQSFNFMSFVDPEKLLTKKSHSHPSTQFDISELTENHKILVTKYYHRILQQYLCSLVNDLQFTEAEDSCVQ